MWNDIQFDPRQVSKSMRSRCESFENQLFLYDREIFREMEDARHVFGSMKTEGASLSFNQTSMIIKGEIPQNSNSRDILETISLNNALQEMRYLLDKKEPFSETIVKRLHKTCSNGLLNAYECGEYRNRQNFIGEGTYFTAVPNQIPKLMKILFDAIFNESNTIIKAALFGFNYVSIHPFIDFNGRTSRLFECYILGEHGYPFISLKTSQISDYLDILKDGQLRGKAYYEPYLEFIYKRVEERFEEIREASCVALRD